MFHTSPQQHWKAEDNGALSQNSKGKLFPK